MSEERETEIDYGVEGDGTRRWVIRVPPDRWLEGLAELSCEEERGVATLADRLPWDKLVLWEQLESLCCVLSGLESAEFRATHLEEG